MVSTINIQFKRRRKCAMIKELFELNEKIRQQEELLLKNKEIINVSKKALDIAILHKTLDLGKQFKENKELVHLSNIERRTTEAMKEPAIAAQNDDISKLEFNVKMLEIEKNYNKRKLNICLEGKKQ